MRIVITGTPGTGKSSVARLLSRRMNLRLIDIKRVARSGGLVGKRHEVDIAELRHALSAHLRGDSYVAEGHLACEFRIPSEAVVVLRCKPAVLRRRLSRRGYGRAKIEENLMSEMLDYCTQRAEKEYGRRPLEADTSSRTAARTAEAIEEAVKHKKKVIDIVDYSGELISHLAASGAKRDKG